MNEELCNFAKHALLEEQLKKVEDDLEKLEGGSTQKKDETNKDFEVKYSRMVCLTQKTFVPDCCLLSDKTEIIRLPSYTPRIQFNF